MQSTQSKGQIKHVAEFIIGVGHASKHGDVKQPCTFAECVGVGEGFR